MGDDPEDVKKRKAQKTYQGYATPGIDEPPRTDEVRADSSSEGGRSDEWSGDETVVEESPSAERGPDESGELYLPPGTVRSPSVHDSTPLVEVEVVHQHGSAPRMPNPPQTLEIWTQNRIYTLDPQLICVGVADRASGELDAKHPFVGYRLVGGQHRDGDTFEISYPFPRPGTEAVFEHPKNIRGNFSRTSTVTRVVLRLHVVTVAPSVLVPTWSNITAHELKLPPSKK